MATWMGLEPTTSAVTGRRSNQLNYQAELCAEPKSDSAQFGGNNRARTYDPLLVRQMLSQLSYAPIHPIFQGSLRGFRPLRFKPLSSTDLFILQHSETKVKGFFKKNFDLSL